MKSIVVAAHPDDETLGAGGTLLRRKAEGNETAWLIVTGISTDQGWSQKRVNQRQDEIEKVSKLLQFDQVYRLDFPAARLDEIPLRELIAGISAIFRQFEPSEIFVPHYSDIHSDHRVVFQAVASCSKWFRYPSVQRILCYETLSETDFGLGEAGNFRPNYFLDVSGYMEKKIEVLRVYSSEMSDFPFPRSEAAVRAQASLRGAASGYVAAEAFELLRERG
jgi:LmbE family N-acetylglucosaminyl deacetylase